MSQEAQTAAPAPAQIDLRTSDLTHVRLALAEIIAGLNAGPRSRARSLVVTKLEEASLWAGEALRTDP